MTYTCDKVSGNSALLCTPASTQDWQPRKWGELRTMTLNIQLCAVLLFTKLRNSYNANELSSQASREGKDDHIQSHFWAEETELQTEVSSTRSCPTLPPHPEISLESARQPQFRYGNSFPALSWPHLPVCDHISIHIMCYMGGMWVEVITLRNILYFESYIWVIMNDGKWSWFLISNSNMMCSFKINVLKLLIKNQINWKLNFE